MRDVSKKAQWPAHQPGTPKGEDRARKGKEPGRIEGTDKASPRFATGIDPEARRPIAPGMPYLPPA